jgi:predicted N-acetyltransferase YhbS
LHDFRLRPTRVDEAPAIAALIRSAFIELAVLPPPSALGETAESVARWLMAGGGAVAEASGEIVGAILWEMRGENFYLGRLAVAPAWRRRGIGRALVGLGEAEARRLGVRRIELGTRLALTDNRRLFATCGFRETTRHCHAGFTAETWVTLERVLA